jgi:hypothetical protein
MKRLALLIIAAAALSVITGAAVIPASATAARPGTAAQAGTATAMRAASVDSFPCSGKSAGLITIFNKNCSKYGTMYCPSGHTAAISGAGYVWDGCQYRVWLYQHAPQTGGGKGPGSGYNLCISPGSGNSGVFQRNYEWAWVSGNHAAC